MGVLTASPNIDRARIADRLWFAAHTFLGVMPVVMAIASRSSTLVIALTVAAALAAMTAEGLFRFWITEAAAVLGTPLGIAVLAFLGFAALSILWSTAPATSLRAYGEFALTLGGTFILAVTLPKRMPRAGHPLLLALSVTIASLIILIELWTDFAARETLFGVRPYNFVFNRSVLTLLVLTIPLVWLLVRWRHPAAAAAVLALVTATVLQSASGAAVLGLLAAAAVFGLVHLTGRIGVSAVSFFLAASILLAPLSGTILDRVLPPSVHEKLAGAHAGIRIEIWKSFGEAVRRDPLAGAGFGISPRFSETRVAKEIAPHDPAAFAVWHPHNAALQAWVELGAIGVALALIVVMLLLSRLAKLPPGLAAVSLALIAAVTAVSLVGHGAWQGWWAAAIGAAVVWLRYDRPDAHGRSQ